MFVSNQTINTVYNIIAVSIIQMIPYPIKLFINVTHILLSRKYIYDWSFYKKQKEKTHL